MADFDAFESAPAEVDPAADFLAREQSELAGLEDDNFAAPESQPESSQELGGLNMEAPAEGQQITSDSGMGDFEIIGGEGNETTDITAINSSIPASNGPSSVYEAISVQDTIRAEPEKIKVWREEQKARLEAKDNEEETKKRELKEVAKKELDDWYKHYDEQLQKSKENNRAAEDAFVSERDEKVTGQAWEKVTRLCEFNPKNSKTNKDVSRFRGILLQLKQTPLVR